MTSPNGAMSREVLAAALAEFITHRSLPERIAEWTPDERQAREDALAGGGDFETAGEAATQQHRLRAADAIMGVLEGRAVPLVDRDALLDAARVATAGEDVLIEDVVDATVAALSSALHVTTTTETWAIRLESGQITDSRFSSPREAASEVRGINTLRALASSSVTSSPPRDLVHRTQFTDGPWRTS